VSNGSPIFYLRSLLIDEVLIRNGTEHYIADALGSAIALTNPVGALTTQYTYEPFGQTVASGNSSDNTIQYTGREQDVRSLYYFRNRYYLPGTARFASEDPKRLFTGSLNAYSYVENNPSRYVDPLGLEKDSPWWEKLWEWYLWESVVPGPYGQPLSEWGPMGPSSWGDPLKYTEEAGGLWKWGERAAVGLAAGAATAALAVGGIEALALGNQSINVGFKGGEIYLRVGSNKFFRLNPFGDWRSNNPYARRPHYHRRGPGGIGRHRPWEPGPGSRF
jgi:RHS repeat-associated protein